MKYLEDMVCVILENMVTSLDSISHVQHVCNMNKNEFLQLKNKYKEYINAWYKTYLRDKNKTN